MLPQINLQDGIRFVDFAAQPTKIHSSRLLTGRGFLSLFMATIEVTHLLNS